MWRESFHQKDLSGGGVGVGVGGEGSRGCSLSWMTVNVETGGVSSLPSTFSRLDDQSAKHI